MGPPSFEAHETECVWRIAEGAHVYVNEDPSRAGNSAVTFFVEDLDARVDEIAERGVDPAERETYSNGVRKAIYRDAEAVALAEGRSDGRRGRRGAGGNLELDVSGDFLSHLRVL